MFFETARLAEYFALFFRGRGFEVLDVHGKTSLSKREQFLETFYSAEKAVVFSSDTLARDMLLPPIDQVLQIGFPTSSEQYLRRVALVADGGKGRYAVLLLLQSETEEAMKIIGEAMHAERRECVGAENWQVNQGDGIPEKAKARASVLAGILQEVLEKDWMGSPRAGETGECLCHGSSRQDSSARQEDD